MWVLINMNSNLEDVEISSSQETDSYHGDDVEEVINVSGDEQEGSEKSQGIVLSAKPTAPCINCPEKIIIILDTSAEMNEPSFKMNSRTSTRPNSTLTWTKKALEMFLVTKSTLNPKHEYAIVIIHNSQVMWLQEFTNDINVIQDSLADIQASDEGGEDDIFLMDQLFNVLLDNCQLPEVENIDLPPDFVYRAIFIYGRSNCILALSEAGQETAIICYGCFQERLEQRSFILPVPMIYTTLHMSPYFFYDALYLHKPADEGNKAKEIFDWLCDFDRLESGYVGEASANPARIFEEVAKLLAHPLQRCKQSQAQYRLIRKEITET